MNSNTVNRSILADFLLANFELDEIQSFCRQIGIELEIPLHSSNPDAIKHILSKLNHPEDLDKFLTTAKNSKLNLNWDTITNQTKQEQADTYGSRFNIGELSGENVVVGHNTTFNQGLSVAQVADLVVELKHQDQPKVWDGNNPYMGLDAYEKTDARYFFGRTKLVDELIERTNEANFVAISGASGSGKSSVAKAGVLYQLEKEGKLPRSKEWTYLAMRPSNDPFKQLANAINNKTQNPIAGQEIENYGRVEPLAFYKLVNSTLLDDDKRKRCVLLIDQFEEIFTLTPEEDRDKFIKLIIQSVSQKYGRLKIIITIRHEFLGDDCSQFPKLLSLINNQQHIVGAMSTEELVSAITLPTLEVGAEIEAALVQKIIQEMKYDPGALPLMSFALKDLFDKESKERGLRANAQVDLTLLEYQEHGGLTKALETHAAKAFNDFSVREKKLTKIIFSKLVELGTKTTDTRRIVALEDLIPTQSNESEIKKIIYSLSRDEMRLITTGDSPSETSRRKDLKNKTMVTITHEKLIEAWPWLKQLIDQNRELFVLQNEINREAQIWRKELNKRGNNDKELDGFLRQGGRLAQLEENWKELDLMLDKNSKDFYQASLDLRQRKKDEEEAHQAKLLRMEKARADVARNLSLIIGVVCLFLIGATIIAFNARKKAEISEELAIKESQISLSQSLALQSKNAIENNYNSQLAFLLGLSAYEIFQENGDESTSRAQLINNALRAPIEAEYFSYINPSDLNQYISLINTTKYNNQYWVATASDMDNAIYVSDTQHRNRTIQLKDATNGHTNNVSGLAFLPNSPYLVSSGFEGKILLWNYESGQLIDVLFVKEESQAFLFPEVVGFSADGKTLITILRNSSVIERDDGGFDIESQILVWDVENGEFNSREPITREGALMRSASSLNGDKIAYFAVNEKAEDDDTVRIVNLANGIDAESDQIIDVSDFKGLEGALDVETIQFSPNGQAIAIGGLAFVEIFNLEGEKPVPTSTVTGHSEAVTSIAFNSDGTLMTTSSFDNSIILYNVVDIEKPVAIHTLYGHEEGVLSATFIGDLNDVVSGGRDRKLRVWESSDLVIMDSPRAMDALVFQAENNIIAAVNRDSDILIWEVDENGNWSDPIFQYALFDDGDQSESLAIHPNQPIIATGTNKSDEIILIMGEAFDKRVPLNDLSQENTLEAVEIRAVEFSPSGKLFVASSSVGDIGLWEVQNNFELLKIEQAHNGPINQLEFHSRLPYLISGSEDGVLKLWQVDDNGTLRLVDEMQNEEGIAHLAFHPTKPEFATSGENNSIRIWEFDPQLQTISVQEVELDAPILLADEIRKLLYMKAESGEILLVSLTLDQYIRFWNADTNYTNTPNAILNPSSSFIDAFYNSTNQEIVTTHENGTVRRWLTDNEAFRLLGCQNVNPEFARQLRDDRELDEEIRLCGN